MQAIVEQNEMVESTVIAESTMIVSFFYKPKLVFICTIITLKIFALAL